MKAHILILLFLCQNLKGENLRPIKADSLLKKNLISIKAKGLFGDKINNLVVEITNHTNTKLDVEIESGRRFVSLDNGEQDRLIVKPQIVTLLPWQKVNKNMNGYCCEMSMHGMNNQSQFLESFLAPLEWQNLTMFLDSNFNILEGACQQAIWAMSDKLPLPNIGSNNANDKSLRAKLAIILKQTVPWYNVEFGKEALQPGVNYDSIMPKMFHADIELNVPHARLITATILDKNKKMIKVLSQNYYIRDGVQTFSISHPLKNYKKGKYYLVISGEKGYRMEKEFEI